LRSKRFFGRIGVTRPVVVQEKQKSSKRELWEKGGGKKKGQVLIGFVDQQQGKEQDRQIGAAD